jgi:hypothetical protein
VKRALLSALVVLAGAATARAGVASVWAVGDGEKIAPDTTASPLAARNAAWDGRAARLFGGRNEVLAFQVIVQADAAGIGALSASLPQLRLRGGDERIRYAPPAKDPSLTAGRPVRLYSVRSMNVTSETHADWVWEPGSPAAPKKTVGWQPVQLVPENARAGRGGFPLKVDPGAAQAIWIEVYTGRRRPAGVYEGTVTVRADGVARDVPVELTLLDLDLPDEGSMDVMVFYEPEQPELYQGRNLDPAYHRFAHAHRVELVHAYDEARVKASLGRLSGADFTAASGYEGPGEGRGNRIVPLTFYGPGRDFDDRAGAWKRADAWMAFLSPTLPGARTFLYLPDEPSPREYPYIRRLADNVHSNPGPGRALPTFVTKSIVPELADAIDIWCVPPQAYDVAKAAAERAKGRRVWFYNGGRPQGPSPVIDAPATEARAVAWAAFKHNADTYFYWHGVHWRHNSQKQGERVQNVWANPVTFDNIGQPNKADFGTINGDGVLLYPGQDVLHSEEDRGIDGPVATVQLANLRRGVQDHLYLTMARQLGLETAVRKALDAVVPRVFSDAGKTVGFAETGETFEAARRELADAIAAARKGAKR